MEPTEEERPNCNQLRVFIHDSLSTAQVAATITNAVAEWVRVLFRIWQGPSLISVKRPVSQFNIADIVTGPSGGRKNSCCNTTYVYGEQRPLLSTVSYAHPDLQACLRNYTQITSHGVKLFCNFTDFLFYKYLLPSSLNKFNLRTHETRNQSKLDSLFMSSNA